MPFDIREIVPQRVCYDKISGDVTMDEVREGSQEIATWLDSLDNNNGILIINVQDMVAFPTNVFAVNKAASPFLAHEKLANIVTYGRGDTIVVQFVINNILPLFGQSARLVDTYSQARQYLINTYPDLEDQLPQTL